MLKVSMWEVLKQEDAVFSAVCEVVKGGSFDSAIKLTSEERERVIDIVTKGIIVYEVEMSETDRWKYGSESELKRYVSGLVSNRLRMDKRLNGNIKC